MRALLAAALLLAACAKDPGPGKAGYEPRDAAFALAAPADWRVTEDQGEGHRVSFFGPPGSYAESIGVYRYEATTPEAYRAARAGGSAGPLTARPDGRFEFSARSLTPEMHGRPPEEVTVRHVLVPAGSVLWALVYTRPSSRPAGIAFDELAASFKPKG
ncbi:hypothetical protein EPO15_11745 [bacterium]|nr:MAG: hypothetical protein EPO15_11745 [bacterium]